MAPLRYYSSKTMEATSERLRIGSKIKEEKRMKSKGDEEAILIETTKVPHMQKEDHSSNPSSPNPKGLDIDHKQVSSVTTTERSSMETDARYSSSLHENQEDLLKSTKAEMGEVREENEKLKLILSKILKDYQSLQMHFHNIAQQDVPKKSADTPPPTHKKDEEEDPEFVSLSLGRFSIEPKRDEKKANKEGGKFDQGLALGLDCRFYQNSSSGEVKNNPSTGNSFGESKEEEVLLSEPEPWPPGKSLKTGRSGDDDDVLQQNPLKKARVSVRAVCSAATMNDGCQWRKYGQKLAKGNPCPRAYYRCTVSPSCPVRKHVQRCVEDMSILVTTYEGTHNHPLPVSATAMASTTSAAASMLRSTSSTSQPGLGTSATTTSANLHGLNFTRPNNSPPLPHPFYFPSTTISTSQSHPTVTLDLTAPINRPSTFLSAPRYSSTCLDFSSSSSYGVLPNTKNHIGSSYPGTQLPLQEPLYQPYNMLNKNNYQSMTDTIAAATKEITSNPSFRSALAAAITSFVGNVGGSGGENRGGGGEHGKCSDQSFPVNMGYAATHNNGIGCATSYLNRLPAANSRQGNLTLSSPPLLPLSASKTPSVSPVEEGEHIK